MFLTKQICIHAPRKVRENLYAIQYDMGILSAFLCAAVLLAWFRGYRGKIIITK